MSENHLIESAFCHPPVLCASFDGAHSEGNELRAGELSATLETELQGDRCRLRVRLRRDGDVAGVALGVRLGIDAYMAGYPDWNTKFFPTMLRCEPTHFWGYFSGPTGKVVGLYAQQPVAAYRFDYSRFQKSQGHRIHEVTLELLQPLLPDKQRELCDELAQTGEATVEIELFFCDSLAAYLQTLCARVDFPVLEPARTLLCPGDEVDCAVNSKTEITCSLRAPDGRPCSSNRVRASGVYTLTVRNAAGFESVAQFYCRRPWGWYLRAARQAAADCPPRATTHCESWYGFFSAFAAAKAYPDPALDAKFAAQFEEVMPLMFDFDRAVPVVHPRRVQNTSSLISLLVARYQADGDLAHLRAAGRFGDWLMTQQGDDGAYYRAGTQHYTCVIYPAKSMLDLATAEKSAAKLDPAFKEASARHYQSAKRAVDDLVARREDIGTEGESTLEDGMLSCAALQLACFARTLPEADRVPYLEAAEHLIDVHRCLELTLSPDCRSRQATIRFWESQYDVMIRENMMTSPHGWSAWLVYADYYLYLLTGAPEHLRRMMDGLGAAIQLVDPSGKLRWAFMNQPYLQTEMSVADPTKPVEDGYQSLRPAAPAYRPKATHRLLREGYIDQVSGWYRTGEQKCTGGFDFCPLVLEDRSVEVDPQGGCCDNDVHEVFKCLAETALGKAFLCETQPGVFEGYGVRVRPANDAFRLSGKFRALHVNLLRPHTFRLRGKRVTLPAGRQWLLFADEQD